MQRAKSSTTVSADGDAAGDGSGSPGRPPVLGARAKTASRPGTRSAPSSPQSAGGTTTPQSSRGGVRTSQATGKTTSVGAAATSPSSQSGSMRQPHDIQYYRERLLEIYKAHNSANVSRVDFLLDKYKGQEDFLYRTVCAKYHRPIDLPATPASAATSAAGSSSAAASTRASDIPGAKSAATTTTTRAKAVLPKPPAKTLSSASRTAATPASSTQTSVAGQGGHGGRNGVAGNHSASGPSSATASSASVSATASSASVPGKGSGEASGKVPNSSGLTNGVASGLQNVQLLREIDFLLLDEDTGFFADDDGGESSGTSSDLFSPLVSDSSASEDEEAAMDTGSHPAAAKSSGAAARTAPARPAAPKQSAYVASAATGAKPPPARTSDTSRAASGAPKVQPATSPAALAKSSHAQTTASKSEQRPATQPSKPAAVHEAPAPAPQADEEAQEDELDLDDADLGAALAANLVSPPPEKSQTTQSRAEAEAVSKTTKLARPPSPKAKAKPPPALSSRGEKRERSASTSVTIPSARPKKDGAPPPVAAADSEKPGAPASTKAKAAWGAPPPLRGRTLNGAKPKASPAAKKPPAEAQPPTLFEQWLAILKLLTGWNDQKNYDVDEIRSHVTEHLSNEGIVEKKTVERLCNSLVPMMNKLRPVDKMLVKNVKADILRGAKIVQISFLRVVAYELMQEQDAKATLAAQKKKDTKAAGPAGNDAGNTYLSKDIFSILKVVNHFKFEKSFQVALKNLIMSIRSQKAPPPKTDPVADGKAKKRKAAEVSNAVDAAVAKEKISDEGGTTKGGREPLKRRKTSN